MARRAHCVRLTPDAPEQGARKALAACINEVPVARGFVPMLADAGDGPGLAVSPWVRTAVSEELDRVSQGELVGDATGPSVPLHIRTCRDRLSFPSAWVGHNLCLTVPLVHRHRITAPTATSQDGGWLGPCAGGLVFLAERLGATQRNEPRGQTRAEWGASLATRLFPRIVVVVDGTWWTVEIDGETRARDPVSACLVMVTETANDLFLLDRWIAHRLGWPQTRSGSLEVSGSEGPWPRAPMWLVHPAQVRTQPLWKTAHRDTMPAIPGDRFGRLWVRRRGDTP